MRKVRNVVILNCRLLGTKPKTFYHAVLRSKFKTLPHALLACNLRSIVNSSVLKWPQNGALGNRLFSCILNCSLHDFRKYSLIKLCEFAFVLSCTANYSILLWWRKLSCHETLFYSPDKVRDRPVHEYPWEFKNISAKPVMKIKFYLALNLRYKSCKRLKPSILRTQHWVTAKSTQPIII